MAKKQSARTRRRKSDAPMPMGGAGLIRFFQDSSQGFKIGPIWTVALAIIMIVVVILGHVGFFGLIFGAAATT